MTNLYDIMLSVRRRSNMENNNFVNDPELIAYINSSLSELDDIMVTDYEDYRVSTFLSILAPNSNIIPLPPDFYKLRGVDFQLSNQSPNKWITLFPFQLTERNKNRSGLTNVLTPYRASLSYRVAGSSIVIMPQEQCTGTYQVWYTPTFKPLSNECSELSIQMNQQSWVEYAVVDCCIKILNKQNMDPSGFLAEKQQLLQRIRNAAKNRDSAGPKAMVNVRFGDGEFGSSDFDNL